jgi:hypothetical protein
MSASDIDTEIDKRQGFLSIAGLISYEDKRCSFKALLPLEKSCSCVSCGDIKLLSCEMGQLNS